MTSSDRVLYTIGHSDHSIEALVDLLRPYDIVCLVDVRSQPYSRWAHQFNRETLATSVREAGLAYHFLGDALGGRPDDPSLYAPGEERPDYECMEQTPRYQEGIRQLLALAEAGPLAIMCSEGDHRQCHRHMLIAQTLLSSGVRVLHIQPDGTTVEGEPIPKQLSLFG
jgi:uncharacterized protein (DUF488 family)